MTASTVGGCGGRARRSGGASHGDLGWRVAAIVTRRPRTALAVSLFVLGALPVPVAGHAHRQSRHSDLPPRPLCCVAEHAIERLFPGTLGHAPSGRDRTRAGVRAGQRARLRRWGARAGSDHRRPRPVEVHVAGDGETALVSIPMPEHGWLARAAARRRRRCAPRSTGRLRGCSRGRAPADRTGCRQRRLHRAAVDRDATGDRVRARRWLRAADWRPSARRCWRCR